MRFLVLVFSVALMSLSSAWAQDSGQILNYRDAELSEFVRDVALTTRKTFILDPEVRGKVNIVSATPVSGDALFETLQSVLRVNGMAMVSTSGGSYKIVKADKSRTGTGALAADQTGDLLVTRVFAVRHTDPVAVLAAIKPYVAASGQSFARKGLPVLIVTDFADNLMKLSRIIETIDVDRTVVRSLALKNSSAIEMAEVAARLSTQVGMDDNSFQRMQAIPVESSNTLILKGMPEVLDQFVPVLSEIDTNNASRGDLKVVSLRHANAEQLLPVLQNITRSGGTAQQGQAAGGQANLSAYTGSNAIIINATPEVQQRITSVIRALDVPRAQVLVEAIIVEVSENAAKELGLQYILAGGDSGNIPFTVTNYTKTAPNILAATGALLVDSDNGSNNDDDDDDDGSVLADSTAVDVLRATAVDSLLGINGFALGGAGRLGSDGIFGVILNALSTDTDSNILSTPSIMTLDNEEASFIAGQEIPITTGEALGSANANPFRTIERKNVGVQLDVKPQINDGDEIRLSIRQEISSVAGPVNAGSSELITNKREIDTTVRVLDGEIVVLGGLIQQNETVSVDKVPFLGDIPVLGRAFRSEGKNRSQTNLMIFLRPTIVRTDADLKAVSQQKYDYMTGAQKAAGSKLDLDAMVKQAIEGQR